MAYALQLGHKHIPEMQLKAGLTHPPVFCPSVIPAFRGMVVEVPLALEAMRAAARPDEMRAALQEYYADSPVVHVADAEDAPPELLIRKSDEPSDRLRLHVFSDEAGDQARLVAVLDNLGKGASGAAVQSLNLMAGCAETAGLRLGVTAMPK